MTEADIFSNQNNNLPLRTHSPLARDDIFSQVLNSLDALVSVVDLKTHEIVFINTYGQNVWGDVEGRICWQAFQVGVKGPCDHCANDRLIGPDGSPTEGVVREVQFTVNKRWFECRGRAMHWPDGRMVRLEIATDITDRMHAEQRARESAAKLRSTSAMMRLLCDNVPDMIWAKDLKKHYVFTNKAICRNLLNAEDTNEPIGKTDMFFAERERKRHADDSEWHTFGEICRDTDTITMDAGMPQQFDEYGNVQGKFLFLDVHKAPFIDERGMMIGTVGSARDVTAARELEQNLKESEARLREVLENSLNASYKRNLKKQSYEYLSPVFTGLSGYTPDEMKSLSLEKLLTLIHPGDLPETKRVIAASMAGAAETAYHVEYRFKHKDGRYRWFHDQFTVMRNDDGQPMSLIGSVSDITLRKQTEIELKKERWRLECIIEGTHVGTWEWNIQTGETLFNETWAEFIGYTLDELAPISIDTWADLTHPDDLKRSVALLERHFAGELQYYDCECRMKHRDGHWIWVHDRGRVITRTDDGKPLMMFGTHADITKRKQSEEALKETEARYRLLFESASDALFLIDTDTGWIIKPNAMASELYGYDPDELLTKKSWDMSAEPEETLRLTQAARTAADQFLHIPLRLHRKKDGSVFPVEITSRSFPLSGRQIILVAVRDITDRKRAEAEKAVLEAQNRQLQKAESLGRMAGAIAHHFNNQLQVVIGNLEMAMDDMPGNPAASDPLFEALKAARKASNISGMMLSYRGQTPGKQAPVDLSEVCLQSLPLLQASAPKKVIFKTDFPASGPIVLANAGQIQLILVSLAANAWEAAGENQACIFLAVKTVSWEDIYAANAFPVGWQPQECVHACLEVADTGCGIACGDIDKLFDPFFTTKFFGRGMGLSVALGIVRAHGGGITVESEPGRGSVFRVYMPLLSEAVPVPRKSVENASEIQGDGTVLVVEDEVQVSNMVNKMLKRLGFTVLEAGNGMEAVEVFRQHRDEIRCVITDLTMPYMDGWETLAALRKLSPDIPVILCSGYNEAQVMAEEHAEVPNAFLGKPYRLQELGDAIRHSLVDMNKCL